jgi:hypothetical protein
VSGSIEEAGKGNVGPVGRKESAGVMSPTV